MLSDLRLPLCLLVAASLSAFVGCSAPPEDEPTGESEDALTQTYRASEDTDLKASTTDSSTLPASSVCRLARGTAVKLSDVTTVGRHLRGRVSAAIAACAGKERFAVGQTVYLFEDHTDAPSAPASGASTLPSCDPQRGAGVIERFPRAMLDAIAFAEGTKGRGQDGYNVIFTYRYTSSCNRHPRQVACSGGLCSDAAGRYQFLSTTWDGIGGGAFNPEHQERAAVKLIARRGVSLPASRPLSATEFTNAMYSLSYEWASLPPGRYGQPNHSMTRMRQQYCTYAGC